MKIFYISSRKNKRTSSWIFLTTKPNDMKKYFTEKQIYLGTFFGGPISAGLLIFKNFKTIEEDSKAIMTLIITLIFSALLFWGLVNIPDSISNKIPDIVFTTFYTAVVYLVYHSYFARLINPKIESNEHKASNWIVAGYSLLGLAGSLALIIWFGYNQSIFTGDIAYFGKIQDEVYYNPETIDTEVVNTIGRILTKYEYFNDETQVRVQIEKIEGTYVLSLIIGIEYISNQEVINFLHVLRDDLSKQLNGEVKIVVLAFDKTGNEQTMEITKNQ